jgi:DNA modification methylase
MADLYQALDCNLDFSEEKNSIRIHNFHSFPAKFPPGIPARMIEELTNPGDVVLDPMCGSGTTMVEAVIANRVAIGYDIDPLSILISKVKTTKYNPAILLEALEKITYEAARNIAEKSPEITEYLNNKWDTQTRKFIDYWFSPDTQEELASLLIEIEKNDDPTVKDFFRLVFSSIIITKTGGVSLALDLAHTRPHKAKEVTQKQNPSFNYSLIQDAPVKPYLAKVIKPAIVEFKKKAITNIQSTGDYPPVIGKSSISIGDARNLQLGNESVNLIVTSPPYASNAIDYMRAHKFSLVWFGYSIDSLSATRSEYVGSESTASYKDHELHTLSANRIVSRISSIDTRKSAVVAKYYLESEVLISEMYRVLKKGGNMVYVVGTSTIKGVDIEVANCLSEIGEKIGFQIPKIAIRKINRDKRMMPISRNKNSDSQIEQRMHEEYVIGFHKG